MLREPAEPPAAEPKQSGSFRYLQGMLEAGEGGKTLAPFPLPEPTLDDPHSVSQSSAPPCLLQLFPRPSLPSKFPPLCAGSPGSRAHRRILKK